MEACSASGRSFSVQRGEAQNDVVASATTILTISRLFLEEVGNDECILREETEIAISASFGGAQLNRRRFNIERGQELRETHATRLALFPTHQEDISTLASHTSENVIRERGILGQNVEMAENDELLSKGMGLVEKMSNRISRA